MGEVTQPPFEVLLPRHPGRRIHVEIGLFGLYLVRLCAAAPAGGPGRHGEILRELVTDDPIQALALVEALAQAEDPDGWRPQLAVAG